MPFPYTFPFQFEPPIPAVVVTGPERLASRDIGGSRLACRDIGGSKGEK